MFNPMTRTLGARARIATQQVDTTFSLTCWRAQSDHLQYAGVWQLDAVGNRIGESSIGTVCA